jgi:hypothetical protein
MARISSYGQDGTLNKLDKVLGTDSATGATKNYSIDSMLGLVNEEDLVDRVDGGSFTFKSYEAGSTTPQGIINLNAGSATQAAFSAINQIYVSVLDKSGLSVAEYLDNADNDFIKISKRDNINQFGIYEVTAIVDHDGGAYKKLTLTPRGTNGNLTPSDEFFVSNYSALYDQDFSDDSVTEFGDVTNAGSGQIITSAERSSLTNFTDNGLIHGDVVNSVTSTAVDVPLSAAQGKVLKDLIDSINTLLTSDNVDLDSLQEVVDYIETNRTNLDNLGISNITGLSDALNLKQNTEAGKGLSANDFTTVLKDKLDNIAAGAQVNVKPDWSAAASTVSEILNKPTDLTNLSIHDVTELRDITSAGSGAIITGTERSKLSGIATGAEVNVQANWNESDSANDAFIQNKPSLAPSNAEQNVQANWSESDNTSDAFIANKPSVALSTTTIEVVGTSNEIEVSPVGAQDLSANRTFTIGLPNDVTIGEDLKVNETIELVNAQTSTPTFDNGIYYSTEDGHDTLHFRYHGHDLSIDQLTENIPTGILNGGEISTNTNTTFDIAAGDGIINILNKGVGSDPHPEIKKISWSATTVTHTLGDANDADQINTWVYVDQNGTIQQTTSDLTPGVWRSNIVLGAVIHSSNVIRFVRTFPRTAYSSGNTYAEFVEIFGPLKKSGHLLTVNSTNTLALDRAAGQAFALGRNYAVDPLNPSLVSDSASTAVFHRYSVSSTGFTKDNGVGGAGFTSIDPSKYDNNGTITAVSGGHYSVQRLYHFPNNTSIIVAYYGKEEYASIDEAEKNYLLENFQEANNTATQAIYLGALIVKGNATDLSNSSQAKILTGGIFRSLSAANLGGVAANSALSDLSDVTITSPTNGQVVKYNSTTGQFENQADAGGIQLTDLSVGAEGTASGDGDVGYDNTTGVFTYTPPDLSAYVDGTGTAGNLPKFSDADTLTDSAISEQAGVAITLSLTGAVFTTGPATLTLDNSNGGVNPLGGWSVGETFTIGYNIQTNNAGFDFGAAGTVVTITSATATGFTGSQFNIPNGETATYVSGSFTYSGSAGTTPSKIGINKVTPNVSLDINGTDSVQMPSGTTDERPAGVNGMFRYNTSDNQFEGYTDGAWGAIAGSGGSSGEIVKQTFSATGGASFSLSDTIVDIDNVNVYVNGVYQYPSNYTVSGSTVTFVAGSIPASGTDNVHIRHNITATTLTEGAAFSTSGNLVGDGVITTFALGGSPRSADHAMVFLEGVYQEKENYSISGSNITFTSAPPNGYSIEVKYVTGVLDLTQPLDFGEIVLDEFTGNGTTTYTLSTAPQSENYTNVYIEGVYQEKGTYSVAGSNIVFSSNIPSGYSIEVSIHKTIPKESVTQTTFVTDTFTANGSTNNFTLVNGSPSSKSLTMVFIQGVYQAKSNYNLVSGEIQFTAGTPSIDDVIEVISISAVNMAGSPVTSVNGEVGAVTAVTSVNGEVGAVTVASKHNVSVISASTTAAANTLYVLTANLNLTLPTSPAMGDSIKISNRSGVATCQLLRNGSNILGAAADLTLDTASASFELIYTDATNGWVIIGQ